MRSMARLNVGVLGLSHDHVWGNLAALEAGTHGRLVAVAEPDARLREKLRGIHGAVAIHETFDALLERRDLDAVLIFSDNRASAELGARALGRGLPVMIEKPMAADLPGARALLAAARGAGVPLMVNWPTAWRPALRHGLTLAREGAVGEPTQLSHRGGHAGPREYGCSPQFCDWLYDPRRNGGGALVDYCGYGAVLCRLVLGRPRAVTAVTPPPRKAGLVAEDHAIAILSYPRALGLLEASWTQIGGEPAFAMIVYGERGTLIVHQPRPAREGERVGPGRVQLVTAEGSRDLEPPPLAPEERDGPTHFLTCVSAGREVTGFCAAEVGCDVQEVLAAAQRSAVSGQRVELPLAGA
jgi:predicted dehydrogenase